MSERRQFSLLTTIETPSVPFLESAERSVRGSPCYGHSRPLRGPRLSASALHSWTFDLMTRRRKIGTVLSS